MNQHKTDKKHELQKDWNIGEKLFENAQKEKKFIILKLIIVIMVNM